MDTNTLKIIFAVSIFFMALAGGLPVIWFENCKHAKKLFSYGESLARGIFLGAGFIHLLPEAQIRFLSIHPEITYPLIPLICVLTLISIFVLDQILLQFYQEKRHIIFYQLAIVLSVHSLIAGSALGIDSTQAGYLVIFAAIIAHKSSAAFALTVSLKNHAPNKPILPILIAFALMTPIGIFFGMELQHLVNSTSTMIESVFDALTAGTFIYIACFNQHELLPGEKALSATHLFFMLLGVSFMALLAVWI